MEPTKIPKVSQGDGPFDSFWGDQGDGSFASFLFKGSKRTVPLTTYPRPPDYFDYFPD